jgi:hypothetical protein
MLDAFRALLDDVASDERPSLAALTIAVRELMAAAWPPHGQAAADK